MTTEFKTALSHNDDSSVSKKIVAIVREFPFRTYNELAEKVNPNIVTADQLHKRLPELRKRGIVTNGQLKRFCTVTHKLAQTWALSPESLG